MFIIFLEEYPSLVEGTGLENREVGDGAGVRIHVSPPLRLPRSQVVRHTTLTRAFASSNLAEATIL